MDNHSKQIKLGIIETNIMVFFGSRHQPSTGTHEQARKLVSALIKQHRELSKITEPVEKVAFTSIGVSLLSNN